MNANFLAFQHTLSMRIIRETSIATTTYPNAKIIY